MQHSINCLNNTEDPDQPASSEVDLDLHIFQETKMCFQKGEDNI